VPCAAQSDLAVNPSNRLEEFEALIAELMMRE
jgi:hypothetical protein